jgi:crossover junction endodeoxyribonuclease RuvC
VEEVVGVAERLNILAIDAALTATGLCLPNGDTLTLSCKHAGMTRIRWIRDRVIQEGRRFGPLDLVVIEGYSYGSKGNSAVNLGELGGVLRFTLWEAAVPYVEIPPSCVKKYATGKGNAGKEDMLQEACLRTHRRFPDNNSADAFWLWQMALARYCPEHELLVKMPKANLEGLVKVPWVELGKEG